jgi:hypothetical protein
MPEVIQGLQRVACCECHTEVNPSFTMRDDQSRNVCYTCITNNHISCSGCQVVGPRTSAFVHDGQLYCRACTRDRFRTCSSCSTLHHTSIMETDEGGTYVCPSCMPEYVRCYESEYLVLITDSVERNGRRYHRDRVPVTHKVQGYSYKPSPNFLGSSDAGNLFFGVELEIEGGGLDPVSCDEILSIPNPSSRDDVMYGKKDSSVENGFELVTHPASFNYHMNVLPWGDLLNKAKSIGYSNTPTSCGVHVHISRSYFGQSVVRQDTNIMKMLYLFEKFWDKFLKFSRRSQSAVSRWADRYGMRDTPREILDYAKSSGNRYRAVNLENSPTIEIRLFKGTLDTSIVRATIQLCYVLATTSKELRVADIQQMTWEQFVNRASEYPELMGHLIERGLAGSPRAQQSATDRSTVGAVLDQLTLGC